jgi:hypothetical protein
MKFIRPLLPAFLCMLFMQTGAQLQWYQNQNGPNQYPSGTMPTSILPYTSSSFLSLYLWSTDASNNFTWKISRSSLNGTEEKTFYITGMFSQVQIKTASNGYIYALESSFPSGSGAEYTIFKLDANLQLKAQRTISLPGGFTINNINGFAADDESNIYLAGDGATQNQSPASFVIKSGSNLLTRWNHIDTIATSFSQLLVDHRGTIWLVEDFYSFYPDIHLRTINSSGMGEHVYTVTASPGRQSISSQLDAMDNLLLYGNETDSTGAYDIYLYKFNTYNRRVTNRKNYFSSPYIYINDLKQDDAGNLFALFTWYNSSWEQTSRVSAIHPFSGNISWSRDFSYTQDSIVLNKLAVSRGNLIYGIGLQSLNLNFTRGFAVRIRKWGAAAGNLQGPDSVGFNKMHYLLDGIADRNNQLISVGATNDLDPVTMTSTYSRAFAGRYNNAPIGREAGSSMETNDQALSVPDPIVETPAVETIHVYPNPARDQITVTGKDLSSYSRLSVMDGKGHPVWQQNLNGSSPTINISALPNGTYTVWLGSANGMMQKGINFVVSR